MESDSVGVERRRLPFTLIENVVLEDLELGPVDVLVYLALAKHADGQGVCWPSMATIAKLARCGRTAAAGAIKRLEARGYLSRTARFRPDGGVTSNVYRLLQVEVRAPVQQADTPPSRGEQGPPRQVNTNYIYLEPDPKRRERALGPAAALPLPVGASAPGSSLPSLLSRLKVEAQARGAPLVVGRDWTEGLGELAEAGIPEGELLQAFSACLETAPERVTFFPRDFLKWRKVARRKAGERGRTERYTSSQERRSAEDLARIRAEQDSTEGRAIVAAAVARLPWRKAA